MPQVSRASERILYLTYFGGGIHGQAVYKSCAVESQFMGYFFSGARVVVYMEKYKIVGGAKTSDIM